MPQTLDQYWSAPVSPCYSLDPGLSLPQERFSLRIFRSLKTGLTTFIPTCPYPPPPWPPWPPPKLPPPLESEETNWPMADAPPWAFSSNWNQTIMWPNGYDARLPSCRPGFDPSIDRLISQGGRKEPDRINGSNAIPTFGLILLMIGNNKTNLHACQLLP